jgi:hypothetical protein
VTPVYGTYLGGSASDAGTAIAIDAAGNAYVTGTTRSADFPVIDGSTYGGGNGNAFVTKLDANGVRVYSTYLGGSASDAGAGIAVDASGNVFVTGATRSADFPVTDGSALGDTQDQDAFVTKLDASGVPVYSTYLGGKFSDSGTGIAVDAAGNAYVAGITQSANFPITDGSTLGGFEDAFVTKLDASGMRVYSLYLGGRADDRSTGIAADASGNAYVTGFTGSADFPVTDGSTSGGREDAFVTKLDARGARVYSTYLGGKSFESGTGIAVDPSGNAYVAGITQSADFPVTDGSTYGGGTQDQDAFVTKLDASGVRVYSLYLGGPADDRSTGIAADASGNAYVTGRTGSMNFVVTNGSTYGGGSYDGFVTKLDTSGVPKYSTYFGESKAAGGNGIAVDASGNAYVTGFTTSTSFPVTDGSAYSGGTFDGFVIKLDTGGVPG